MAWQELLESTSDLEVTQQEVVSMAAGIFESAVEGLILVGAMSMVVKGFYEVLGEKKLAKQEKEVLKLVEEIW